MSVTLFKAFATGETDYIAQLNNNATAVETALNQLFAQLTGQVPGSQAVPAGLQWIFDRPGIIGIGSYDFTPGNGTTITAAAGAFWSGATFLSKATASTLSFAGLAAGTYYIYLDSAGNPAISSSVQPNTVRTVAWDGSGVTSNKALYSGVAVLLSGADYAAMLDSIARAKTFTSVAERLEEIEQFLAKGIQTPASADTITVDWSKGDHVRITLDRATTTINMTGAYDSQKCTLELIQDATGGRAVAFGAMVNAGTDLTFPVPLSQAANKTDYLGFIFDQPNGGYRYVSLSRGY